MKRLLISFIPWCSGTVGLGLALNAYGVEGPSWLILPAGLFVGIAWGTRDLAT